MYARECGWIVQTKGRVPSFDTKGTVPQTQGLFPLVVKTLFLYIGNFEE